ncbi:MAG: hypothetical protein IMY70_04960, partial [Bacteroidetes bacterium]|nr:hypothetical protein [Bacteroidota bacterium]
YKIYRRLRYLRYVKRKRKQVLKELKKQASREAREVKLKEKERLRIEKSEDKKKKRLERKQRSEEYRKIRTEQAQFIKENKNKYIALEEEKSRIDKKKRKERKKRIRRLIRFLFRKKIRNFKTAILSVNRRNIHKAYLDFKKSKTLRGEFTSITINATALFVLSYLFIFFFSMLASAIASTIFDFSSIIYYYNVYFFIRSDEWYADAVKVIFSSGPVAALFLGTLLLIIFSYIREDKGIFKMFYFWGFLHGYSFFFGGLLTGTLFSRGFGHVIIWSYIMDTGKLVYSFISVAVLITIGLLSTKSFLISANSYYTNINKKNRTPFIFAQVVMPFILGTIILTLIRLPKIDEYFIFVTLTLLLVIIPILANYRFYPVLYFEEEKITIKTNLKLFISTIIIIVLFRIILAIGIPIG